MPSPGMAATGGWSVVASENAAGSSEDLLNGVACATPSDCWAVGYYKSSSINSNSTLTEHYDGHQWRIVSSPNETAESQNRLRGVACPRATSCWAVGYSYGASEATQTLIEHYDGTAWKIEASAAGGKDVLEGVTCVSDSDCWAVGSQPGTSNERMPLIEHFLNGIWTVVPSAPASSQSQSAPLSLRSVACASATDCSAAGLSGVLCGSPPQPACAITLIEHYDGTQWSILTSPNGRTGQPGDFNFLNGVSCASSTYCVAVGASVNNEDADSTLILQNTGSGWTAVSHSGGFGIHGIDKGLLGVSCSTGTFCVATEDNGRIEQSAGGRWTVAESPSVDTSKELSAATCTSGCFAVGSSGSSNSHEHTLIEQFTGPDPTGLTVSCAPNLVEVRRRTKCTATRVFDAFTGQHILTGTLTWSSASGTFSSSTCTLRKARRHAGSCSVRFTPTSAGAQPITATYAGGATHASGEESTTLRVATH